MLKLLAKQAQLLADLERQKTLILGLGREGLSSYRFFRQQFPSKELFLADQQELKQLSPSWQKIKAEDKNLQWSLGKDYAINLDCQLIVKTAGIPLSEMVLQQALQSGSKITSNTALFFEFCPRQQIVGVTGTKGKSTTSSLIYQILKTAGRETVLLGNIGKPALDYLDQISSRSIVVNELSSHQLATLKTSPHWAIVQDILPEHLDYYRNFEEYFQAKTAIARHQKKEDIFIYNAELKTVSHMAKLSQGQKFTHSLTDASADLFLANDLIYFQQRSSQEAEAIISVKDIPLVGKHNLYNVMPAILLAKLLDIETDFIVKGIKEFKSLPHRLERVAAVAGVEFINDSIATIPHAASAAIHAFPKGRVILLAGGHERQQDFSSMADVIIEQSVKAIFYFPTTGQRLKEFIEKAAKKQQTPIPKMLAVDQMNKAVEQAAALASEGDVVLLSPAAASFGLFKDYQDRGHQFAQAAQDLAKQEKIKNKLENSLNEK